MDRLTKPQLDDYCENAGLTKRQKDILRLKYFDERDLSIVQICIELNISKTVYYISHDKMLQQIYKYEYIKKGK